VSTQIPKPNYSDFMQMMREWRLGQSDDAKTTTPHLRLSVELGFAPTSSRKLRADCDQPIEVSLSALVGPCSVLPWSYTHEVLDSLGGTEALAVLQAFQARMLELLADSVEAGRPDLTEERRTAGQRAESVFRRFLAEIASAADVAANGNQCLREQLVSSAALFLDRRRSSYGLRQLVRCWLGEDVQCREFIPEWMPIRAVERTRLGASRAHGGDRSVSGYGVLGCRVWLADSRCELIAGPVSWRRFVELTRRQPGRLSPADAALRLASWYTGTETRLAIRFRIAAGQTRAARLGGPRVRSRYQLGRNAWCGQKGRKWLSRETKEAVVVSDDTASIDSPLGAKFSST